MQNQTIDLSGLGRLDDLSIGLKPSLLMRRLRDERGEPFTPDGWQVEYLDSTDPAVLLLAYRQSGKTTGTAVRALHTCLFEPGRLVLIISPTDRQSGIVLDRVKGFYRQLGGSLGETARETEHRVRFGNGAEVVSLPGIADAIRGSRPSASSSSRRPPVSRTRSTLRSCPWWLRMGKPCVLPPPAVGPAGLPASGTRARVGGASRCQQRWPAG